jgi:hypothetical protein
MRPARWLPVLALAALIAAPLAAAEPYRVRGKLTAVALPAIEVETATGEHLSATLGEDSGVFQVTPGSLADLQAGQFVGITSIDGQGGQRVALEVHIFAEDLRGVGEGHYPWDLVSAPNMMTNATVAEIETVADGPLLALTYKTGKGAQATEGSQQIVVPDSAPVVHLSRAERSQLTPGKAAFLLLQDGEDGQPVPLAIAVGEGGAAPPM